jgi:hypothetical protein
MALALMMLCVSIAGAGPTRTVPSATAARSKRFIEASHGCCRASLRRESFAVDPNPGEEPASTDHDDASASLRRRECGPAAIPGIRACAAVQAEIEQAIRSGASVDAKRA